VDEVGNLLTDLLGIGTAVASFSHIIGDIGVCATNCGHRFIEFNAPLLIRLDLLSIAWIDRNEIMLVFRGGFWWSNRLNQSTNPLQGRIEVFPTSLNTIGQQAIDILFVVTTKCIRSVIINRALERIEKVTVVNDVAVILRVTIKTIDSANSLEETVILHILIDV